MSGLETQHKNDVLIARFTTERIVDEVLVADIGRELLKLKDRAPWKLLLDFRGVDFISASLMGRIVLLSKKCKASRTRIKMCNLSPSVRSGFAKRNLDTIFQIYDSADEAVNAFDDPSI